MLKKVLITTAIILFGLSTWLAVDIHKNNQIEMVKSRPQVRKKDHVNRILLDLEQDQPVNFSNLDNTLEFINKRYDTADFHLQTLTRIVYNHWDKIDQRTQNHIRDTFLNFKYWMDKPGADGMCFWSENHQLLFATVEYLAGQRWPNEVFTNTGKTGEEHKAMAKDRLLVWLEQRWLYGFTEWYSNVYYVEDIAPLSNLIEFAKNEEIVTKATIIMDLLLHDVATQSYHGTFISTSGRLYQSGKFSGKGTSMRSVIEHIWGRGRWGYQYDTRCGLDLNFIFLDGYKVLNVIKAIGEDESTVEIKATNGLNIDELKDEGLYGLENRQIMMQWAMESFTNPKIIANSMNYISKYDMLTNEFLHGFKVLNIGLIKSLHLLPTMSRVLNPVTDGTAIQRANTYTYKTTDYMLTTAQSYHPGTFGDQHHIWNATISNKLSIFTTHPAKPIAGEGGSGNSPGYWVGSGRLPHAAQDKNIALIIYQIPDRRGFMESALYDYTHAHFPRQAMDESILDGTYAFGRYKDTFFAFIARNELSYHTDSDYDLIQHGKDSYWIFEVSSANKEVSFDSFKQRIKNNPVDYNSNCLIYKSNATSLELTYKGNFKVDGNIIETEYPRFQSPYSQTGRKAKSMTLTHAGKSLFLDFYNLVRQEKITTQTR